MYSPDIWVSLAAVLAAASIGLYAWRRNDVPAAHYLAISFLLIVPWQLAVAAEAAAASLHARAAWHAIGALFPLPIVTAAACFVFEYVRPGKWLTRRTLILLWLPPLLSIFLALTNESHHLFWRRLVADGAVVAEYGAAAWILIGYVGLLSLVQIGALGWLFWHSPAHRVPAGLLLGVVAATRTLWLLSILVPPSDTRPLLGLLVVILPTLVYALALFGFRILDPMPAARQTVLEQMLVGMVVFDARQRIVNLNPAAARMLGVRSDALIGKTWQQSALSGTFRLAPACVEAAPAIAHAGLAEVTMQYDGSQKLISPTLSTLYDFRGLHIGHLLMLHDVTEQRKAQAQVAEQQQALASLRERELFARELHDSIGQVLGYAGLQADAVGALIENGQLAVARTQLERLAGVLRDAHADVRQQILDLRSTPDAQQPFCDAIRHYLAGFSRNYDISTALAIDENLCADDIPPAVQSQLFRIMQEALANARKHSGARHVQVAIACEDGILRTTIMDDGCGMDPCAEVAAGGAHWGVGFMRERAEALSGHLRIESAPGAGTRVVVELPEKVN